MRYAVSPDAACAAVEDGTVVLNMRTKRYYSLNETGAAIWRMLEDDRAVTEIVAQLIASYDIDESAAASTVGQLLAELSAESLIVPAPPR